MTKEKHCETCRWWRRIEREIDDDRVEVTVAMLPSSGPYSIEHGVGECTGGGPQQYMGSMQSCPKHEPREDD